MLLSGGRRVGKAGPGRVQRRGGRAGRRGAAQPNVHQGGCLWGRRGPRGAATHDDASRETFHLRRSRHLRRGRGVGRSDHPRLRRRAHHPLRPPRRGGVLRHRRRLRPGRRRAGRSGPVLRLRRHDHRSGRSRPEVLRAQHRPGRLAPRLVRLRRDDLHGRPRRRRDGDAGLRHRVGRHLLLQGGVRRHHLAQVRPRGPPAPARSPSTTW